MSRRRQIADSNPKSLTPTIHHSVSSSAISSPNASKPVAELRPTKSIIIGGGQPIVIPGQLNITNDPTLRQQQSTPVALSTTASASKSVGGGVLKSFSSSELKPHSTGFIASLFGKNDAQEAMLLPTTPPLTRLALAEQKIISVEEFCPDGGMLEKGFLDDLPTTSNGAQAGDVVESERYVHARMLFASSARIDLIFPVFFFLEQ